MKKFLLVFAAAVLLYSCSAQKETEKPKEEIKQPPVVIEKKKRTIDFTFDMQHSGTTSSLRGISVIDSLTAWATGSKGTVLHTTNGGNTWIESHVKGFETLDYRDVQAFDKNTALIMSVDAPAFFFKTTDGGRTWKRKYMNRDPKIFFDGIAFRDDENGIAFSDPIDGKFYIVETKDGGNSWNQISKMNIPAALKNEGGFAASGTAITVSGKDYVWFGTGGSDRARIFYSEDGGENWRASDVPVKSGNASSGVFSIAFKDELNGIAVGGDYKNDKDNLHNCAFTDDGGLSWQALDKNQPGGFRSCVEWNNLNKFYLTTGTSGTDYSVDEGKTWIPVDGKSFNSIGFSKEDGSCFMVGDKGVIAKVRFK
jgi:photosystem II stability/assembly factor-like uncharacterized protein